MNLEPHLLNAAIEVLRAETARGVTWLPSPEEPDESRSERGDRQDPELVLNDVASEVAGCTKCPLAESRTNTVPGEGSGRAELMFVGEAPGRNEDRQGRPFVGRAGHLLTKIIQAMGLDREDVYITNTVKCRPPKNRTPTPTETLACRGYLLRQLRAIRPAVICALGRPAAQTLLQTSEGITRIRGHFHYLEIPKGRGPLPARRLPEGTLRPEPPSDPEALGILVMPTFHPAYLLRNPRDKKLVWEDVQKILPLIETRRPPATSGRR